MNPIMETHLKYMSTDTLINLPSQEEIETIYTEGCALSSNPIIYGPVLLDNYIFFLYAAAYYEIFNPMSMYLIDQVCQDKRYALVDNLRCTRHRNYILNYCHSGINKVLESKDNQVILATPPEQPLQPPCRYHRQPPNQPPQPEIQIPPMPTTTINTMRLSKYILERRSYIENGHTITYMDIYSDIHIPLERYQEDRIKIIENQFIDYNIYYPNERRLYGSVNININKSATIRKLPKILQLHCTPYNNTKNFANNITNQDIAKIGLEYIWGYAYTHSLKFLTKRCELYYKFIKQKYLIVTIFTGNIYKHCTTTFYSKYLLEIDYSLKSYIILCTIILHAYNNKLELINMFDLYPSMYLVHRQALKAWFRAGRTPISNIYYHISYPTTILDTEIPPETPPTITPNLIDLTNTIIVKRHNKKVKEITDINIIYYKPYFSYTEEELDNNDNPIHTIITDDEELILFLTFVNTPDPYNSYIHPDYKSLFLI